MTFTEAALEVLRSAGEPLHYKRITELAIERNLLSHVGKSPEITMISRLATLVKTDRGQGPIVKVKPGVFAARATGSLPSTAEAGGEESAGDAGAVAVGLAPIPGADVFPAEDDDDDLILAGLDEGGASSAGGGGGGGGEGAGAGGGGEGGDGGRRRRRRRRGRGGRGGEQGQGQPGQQQGPGGGGSQGGPPQGGQRRDFPPRDHGGGFSRNGRHGGGGPRREPDIDLSRVPGDGDLLGRDLADAAFVVLSQAEHAPASFARVADLLVRRGRLSGDAVQLAPTVAAALRADAALAAKARVRARFRIRGGEVSLASWRLPREAARFEEDAERAAERQRSEVRRAFVARLNDLPAAGFAELLASWLNAEGVTALRAVRRPGGTGNAFHFAGTLRRGAEEQRLAVVVQRGGRDIDREAIIEVRGSLAHYGNATASWLVSTGRVTSGAREELAVEGATPCAAFDGQGLAAAMERAGIGLRQHLVALADIDFDLLEALGDNSERRERDRAEQDRDRERTAAQPAVTPGADDAPVRRDDREADEDQDDDSDRGGDAEGDVDLEELPIDKGGEAARPWEDDESEDDDLVADVGSDDEVDTNGEGDDADEDDSRGTAQTPDGEPGPG